MNNCSKITEFFQKIDTRAHCHLLYDCAEQADHVGIFKPFAFAGCLLGEGVKRPCRLQAGG